MIKCMRCNTPYQPNKSNAELTFTYCSSMCQMVDIGGPTKDMLIDLTDFAAKRKAKVVEYLSG